MIIRECKEGERKETINLINDVFRTGNNMEPTMGSEYPLLLGSDNLDHIIIAKVDNKVVAVASYYITDIIVQGSSLKSASIGAVCTYEEFRGQGLATKLLDYIDNKLIQENVLLQIISGKRGLYTSRDASSVGESTKFIINKHNKTSSYKLEEYTKSNQTDLIELYNKESVRYYRSYDEFVSFQKGATHNWGPHEFKIFFVKNKIEIIGYIVVGVNTETQSANIVEFAGSRLAIAKVLPKLYDRLQVKEVVLSSPWNDLVIPLLKDDNKDYNTIDQECSIKVMDYIGITNSLKLYFAQYLTKEELSDLSFKENNNQYIIQYKDEEIVLESIRDINLLLFGGLDLDLDKLCQGKPKIYELLKKIFPLPFVWMSNMNYI